MILMTDATKPPTQIAGVQGIDATQFATPEPQSIPRRRLAELPPFQMFAAEKRRPVESLAMEKEAVAEYVAWHEAKGYWQKETPFGELIGGG